VLLFEERTVIIKHSRRKRTRVGGRMVAKQKPDDTGVYSLPGGIAEDDSRVVWWFHEDIASQERL